MKLLISRMQLRFIAEEMIILSWKMESGFTKSITIFQEGIQILERISMILP